MLPKFIYPSWAFPWTADLYVQVPTSHCLVSISRLLCLKPKILIFLSKPASPTASLISINAYFIHSVAQIRNLGVILDSSLSHCISRKYPEYPASTGTTKDQATLLSHPDDCNSVLNSIFLLLPLLSYSPFSQKQPGWFLLNSDP